MPYLDQGISNLTPDVELSEALHAQIFESPAAEVPMRELYREIAQLFRSTFVIYIDLSHLFGEPCMLRYAIRPERDFDAQWDEIRALKSNAQGAVVHQWHLHLDPKERWATCLQSPSSAYLHLGSPVPFFVLPVMAGFFLDCKHTQNTNGGRNGGLPFCSQEFFKTEAPLRNSEARPGLDGNHRDRRDEVTGVLPLASLQAFGRFYTYPYWD